MFPNNSTPLSILPLPLRSSTRKAFVEPGAVHDNCTGTVSLRMSKGTPPIASVIENPAPLMSTIIGEVSIPSGQLQESESYPVGLAHRLWNVLLRVQGPPKINPVIQPVEG